MEFQKNIDKLVSQILSEEIKMRHEEKFGKKGQWMEVEMDEELHGDQHKIDVAKLTFLVIVRTSILSS